MKLNVTIDGKTYEVEVEAAEPESPAAAPQSAGGLNIGSAPLRVPAGSAPVAPPVLSAPGAQHGTPAPANPGQQPQSGPGYTARHGQPADAGYTPPRQYSPPSYQ